MSKKQSVLLGLRDKLEKTNNNMLDDFLSKFKNKQEIFQGHNKTYVPMDGFADDPTKRSFRKVSSTVREQLEWLNEYSSDYLSTVFSIEKTNSTGIKSELVVDGESWGEYSVLELLRLKTIMDGKLKTILHEIPIRDEKVLWQQTTQDYYGKREVWETKEITNKEEELFKMLKLPSLERIKTSHGLKIKYYK